VVLQQLEKALAAVNQVVLGKDTQVRMALTCLLARGHLLLEDLPGMGKTTLSHALAQMLGLNYQRIQFTADLLPGDILGTSVFERNSSSFVFHPGPIFTEVLLADEINRATPKSQSALLEAMEERQVTVEGNTRSLPEPFFVIATQNPLSQSGTFSLPESQLDRFLMRLSLGYPDRRAEQALLGGSGGRQQAMEPAAILDREQLLAAQQQVAAVNASDALIAYILRLAEASRNHHKLAYGLSPRGSLALLAACRAWAFLAGRDYVIPEDVQTLAPAVVAHRLGHALSGGRGYSAESVVDELLNQVPAL